MPGGYQLTPPRRSPRTPIGNFGTSEDLVTGIYMSEARFDFGQQIYSNPKVVTRKIAHSIRAWIIRLHLRHVKIDMYR